MTTDLIALQESLDLAFPPNDTVLPEIIIPELPDEETLQLSRDYDRQLLQGAELLARELADEERSLQRREVLQARCQTLGRAAALALQYKAPRGHQAKITAQRKIKMQTLAIQHNLTCGCSLKYCREIGRDEEELTQAIVIDPAHHD